MAEFEPVWALGLMSGTSMDGVDGALLRTDGVTISGFGASAYRAYAREEQRTLRSAAACAPNWVKGDVPPADEDIAAQLHPLGRLIRNSHRDVVRNLIAKSGETPEVIGLHGQTLLHRPDIGWSLQWPRKFAIPLMDAPHHCVTDFRTSDLKTGGQGAPLAPFFHHACAKWAGLTGTVGFLNLGGVGNLTLVDCAFDRPEEDGALLAFDTGPANAPLNDLVSARQGSPFDKDGLLAREGAVDPGVLDQITALPYFSEPPPKSLDRDDFSNVSNLLKDRSDADAAATLTALPAACVAANLAHLPHAPDAIYVSGGGARNPVMMEELRTRLPCPVMAIEQIGLDGEMLEAQAFAYLAVRSLRGLPLSAPGTTGCSEPVSGGIVTRF